MVSGVFASACVKLFLCMVAWMVVPGSGMWDDDYSVTAGRVIAEWIPTDTTAANTLYTTARSYMTSLRPDGSWSDINYNDTNRVYWATADHLNPRVVTMARAYRTPNQPLYNSTALLASISSSLSFWLVHDFQNPNWWWNQISVPLSMGEISMLAYEHETQAQRDKARTILWRADWKQWTGANLVWMATVHIYYGLSYGNQTDTKEALAGIYNEVQIANGELEGIKIDGSFFQHGQQIYGGGYGSAFTSMVLNVITWTVNTTLYIPASELSNFGTLTLDGQQWSIYEDKFDYSVTGRQLTRPSGNGAEFSSEEFSQVAGPRHAEFVAFAERLAGKGSPLVGNRHFWKGDYMVHRRPNYMTSVRMHSTRTYNSECVNDEGKLSLHLGDGVNYVYMTMKEYTGIFPVWNWDRLPGITNAPGAIPLNCATAKVLGSTTFVGGVSDGVYGVAAYDFQAPQKGKVSAKKAWFFFDDAYVSLGAGIASGYSGSSLGTFVEQKLLQGPVYVSASSEALSTGKHAYPKSAALKWVHHGDVGYILAQPGSQAVNVTLQQQVGNWNLIGATTQAASANVFDLAIDHGMGDIKDATYAYVTVPAINYTSFQNAYPTLSNQYSVVSNSEMAQAVFNNQAKSPMLGVVFWEAGSVSAGAGLKVTSSQPGAVLVVVNEGQSTVEITASNPSQNPSYNHVTISLDRTLSGASCGSTGQVVFDLPTGEGAGKSLSIVCKYSA